MSAEEYVEHKNYTKAQQLIVFSRPQQDVRQSQDIDSAMQDTSSQPASAPTGKRRPKLDLNALGAGLGERKRGKSMFGVLLNTLNKAKAEDKERSASEAVSFFRHFSSLRIHISDTVGEKKTDAWAEVTK